jgi:hypothetical protein
MQSSVFYVAGTPEMYQSEKGFPEYDALRSRLVSAAGFAPTSLVDWRGVIVDLTKTPLPHDILLQLTDRIVDLHAVARAWNPREHFTKSVIEQLVAGVESQAVTVTKPRLLSCCAATLLEVIEQNREQTVPDMLQSTLKAVQASLSKKADTKQWD